MRITPTQLVLPVLASGALLLSGCGSTDEPAASTPTSAVSATAGPAASAQAESNNTVDVDFATGMIPHHGQAIEMADLALAQAKNPKVKSFAERVKAAQAPEIKTLSEMLTGWGEPVPADTGHGASMPEMDHGDMGMMSAEQMGDLEGAKGRKFDRMWIDMMIAHHEGAVKMSQDEVKNGGDEKAKQLAQTIADAQTKEIAELRSLRTDLA
jgi:uncharacterized protein (DUF305 family)